MQSQNQFKLILSLDELKLIELALKNLHIKPSILVTLFRNDNIFTVFYDLINKTKDKTIDN